MLMTAPVAATVAATLAATSGFSWQLELESLRYDSCTRAIAQEEGSMDASCGHRRALGHWTKSAVHARYGRGTGQIAAAA